MFCAFVEATQHVIVERIRERIAECRLSRAAGRGRNLRRGPVHSPGEHEGHRRTECRRANAQEFARVRRSGEVDTTRTNATTGRPACCRDTDSTYYWRYR